MFCPGRRWSMLYVLTRLVFAAFLCGKNSPAASEIRYQSPPISVDEKDLGYVVVYDGQEPADVIFEFAQRYSLPRHIHDRILKHACGAMECTRTRALIFSQRIQVDGRDDLGELELFEGEDPATVASEFGNKNKLPLHMKRSLLDALCNAKPSFNMCNSSTKVVAYSQKIVVDNADRGTLVIMDGDEPADVVWEFCKEQNLLEDKSMRDAMIKEACTHVPTLCTRSRAIFFSTPVVVDGKDLGTLQVNDGDGEAIDVVHRFCEAAEGRHEGFHVPKGIRRQIFSSICGATSRHPGILCTRDRAILYSTPIQVDGVLLDIPIEILEGEEAADAIWRYVVSRHRLGPSIRAALWNKVCNNPERPDGKFHPGILCSRSRAVLYETGPINVDGRLVPSFRILEEKEPVDQLYEWAMFECAPPLPYTIQSQVLSRACEQVDVNCTRKRALLASTRVNVPASNATHFGSAEENITQSIEIVNIFHGEEPIDQISRFLQMHNMTAREDHLSWRNGIFSHFCENPRVRPYCTRDRPSLYEQNIQVPSGWTKVLSILEGDSPSQAIYNFASSNGLGKDAIDELIRNVCAPPLGNGNVTTCENMTERHKNVVLRQPIQVDDRKIEEDLLLHDDDSEPADVIDKYVTRNNLPEDMRYKLIERVCSSGKVVCSRTLPVIFRWPLLNFTSGDVYGEIEVLEGDEPADAIHMQLFQLCLDKPEFLYGLNSDFDALQQRLQETTFEGAHASDLPTTPDLRRKMEGEKVLSADDDFSLDNDPEKRGLIPLEKRIISSACEKIERNRRGKCKRRRALLYERQAQTDAIVPTEPCRIWAGQEATDAILRFTQRWELPDQIHEALLKDACSGNYHHRGLVCNRAEAMIMRHVMKVNVSVNATFVWRDWKNAGERAAWDVIVHAKRELLKRVEAREEEVALVRDGHDKEEDKKGVLYMLKKSLGLDREWRPAADAGGVGRGIRFNEEAVLRVAARVALAEELNVSTASKDQLKEAALSRKEALSFKGFFSYDDDTADLRADPHLYSHFSISPASYHRWRHAVMTRTMNDRIDLITMNANAQGRLDVGEHISEYIPLHGDYMDSKGKYWPKVEGKDVEKFLKAQDKRDQTRKETRWKRNDQLMNKIKTIDIEEKKLREEKGWIPLSYMREQNITNITQSVFRTIRFMQGVEPADAVHKFHLPLRKTGFTYELRNKVIRQACEDRRFKDSKKWSCSRHIPALINSPFNAPSNWGGAYLGRVVILEGQEPADVILEFSRKRNVPPALRSLIIGGVCSYETKSMWHPDNNASLCNRRWPILFNKTIELKNEDGKSNSIGPVLVYGSELDQPVDQIDSFARREGLSRHLRDRIIDHICSLPSVSQDCGRRLVSHWSVNVGGAVVEFLEGQEAADILFRAYRKAGKPQHQRERVYDLACRHPLVQCSRRRAILWSNEIDVSEYDEDEPDKPAEVDRLVIWDDVTEVADAVWVFGKKHGWDYDRRFQLTRAICSSPEVGNRCSRSLGSMAWIPVNRDDNITCPREPFERPLDGKDLVDWFFTEYKDTWTKAFEKCEAEWLRKKIDLLHKSVVSDKRRKSVDKKWWKKNLAPFVCPPEWIFPKLNRSELLPEPYNNASFPVPWLVIEFETHIGFPVMLLFGAIPLLTTWVILNLHGCRDDVIVDQNATYGCCVGAVSLYEYVKSFSAKKRSPSEEMLNLDEKYLSEGTLKRKSRKRNKASVRKRRTEYTNGRMRTKTPLRVTESAMSEYDSNGKDSVDCDCSETMSFGTKFVFSFGRCCCCWSCDCFRCCFRRCICPARCVARCERLHVVPAWRPSLLIVAVFVLHVVSVRIIYTDVVNGFFIMNPYEEAQKYFDAHSGNYMGRVEVLENEEPVESLYEFASVFGTYGEKHLNTPILRLPRFWRLFDQLCKGYPHLDCSRRKPREQLLQAVSITQYQFKQEVHYRRPDHPDLCKPIHIAPEKTQDGKGLNTTSCVMETAMNFCDRQLEPGSVPNCYPLIAKAIEDGIKYYQDTLRWDGKNHYRALELTRDVYNGTIRQVAINLTREMAVPCFKGPTEFSDMKKMWKRIGRVGAAVKMTDEPDERDFYDQPCRVVFGSMCARTKKSGDMLIEQMN